MDPRELVELMASAKSEKDWNDKCDFVIKTCGGYPSFWYQTIILSGLLEKKAQEWGIDHSIRVT